jgi:putative transposase
VIEALMRLSRARSSPRTIRVDNGPEFISKVLDQWAYVNGVELDFSRPGKPTDNAFIEAFDGRLREECLNENWFLSLEDAREKVEAWREEYNRQRPHIQGVVLLKVRQSLTPIGTGKGASPYLD